MYSLCNLTFASHLSPKPVTMIDLNDTRDPQTGLFNQRYLDEILPREISRAQRQGTSVGLGAIEIDFQTPPQRTVRPANEPLLWELGYVLQLHLRAEDTACRVGAGEFVLILPDMPPLTLARRLMEVRATLERHYDVRKRGPRGGLASITLATATFPEDGLTARVLMQSLRDALERARMTAGLAPTDQSPLMETE